MEIIERFYKQSGKGLATLSIVNQSCAVEFAKFDPDTGETVDPEVLTIGLKEIDSIISDYQSKLDNAKAFKTEMIALGLEES